MFLMSPCSANKSVMSSSEASSWMFVAMTIQPSILRTATAFSSVFASVPAEGFLLMGDDEPLSSRSSAGVFESISISVAISANKSGLGVDLSARYNTESERPEQLNNVKNVALKWKNTVVHPRHQNGQLARTLSVVEHNSPTTHKSATVRTIPHNNNMISAVYASDGTLFGHGKASYGSTIMCPGFVNMTGPC